MPTEVKRFTYESNKTTRMNETVGFLLRLQVKIGRTLRTDQACLSTLLAGREIKIKSSNDQPLSKTKWIVLEARGFATETEARDFGEQLRSIVQIAALCSHLGADAGLDKTIGWVNEDLFRSEGFLEPHRRIEPTVHGLLILPDDENTLFLHMEAIVTVKELLVSDDHEGLKAARRAVYPSVPWHRCQFHQSKNAQQYARRKEDKPRIAQAMRDIFDAPSREDAEELKGKVVNMRAFAAQHD